jgi:cytochrome c peroxidase
MSRRLRLPFGVAGLLAGLLLGPLDLPAAPSAKDSPHPAPPSANQALVGHEWQVPHEGWKMPFKDEQPIRFVNRNTAPAEWDKLPKFWNETTEQAVDPKTGQPVTRRAVTIKVPLGLASNPPIPLENPLTVARWALGKQLYFDPILSSDGAVSCASCHDPHRGYTDRSPVSSGIRGLRGGMSAPTVFNSAYHVLQFWDGRGLSLEDQAQGPVQNPVEMFDGEGHAWSRAVQRVRARPEYVKQFRAVFGTEPTRDGIAKAIACYERTVLSGNSIHDRAELAMRRRVEEDDTGRMEFKPADYEKVLQAAFAAKDGPALEALGLNVERDAARVPAVARSIDAGRALFFGKARCNSCHSGDNFTDNQFHNLGVGAKDGRLPPEALGRFAALPTGHKNPDLLGAFKTPTLRHLVGTAPYMHNGSEKTLAEVVEFYDRGGNANEFLDPKMRDFEAERTYEQARRENRPYKGPEVKLCGPEQKPVVPLRLNLTAQEKQDLVMFLRGLQGDPADPVVADRHWLPR